MSSLKSRRNFIINLGSLAAVSILPGRALASTFESPLYPPVDLSYFEKPLTAGASAIRVGYAAITWGGDDMQAIKDISELGFRGIQLRSNLLKEYGDKRASRVTNDLVIVTLVDGETSGSVDAQGYIAKAAMRALRKDAEEHLPLRLQELAYQHNFSFRSVTIKHLKRRWGSCTTRKDIALNLFLVELEQPHIDYVLLHELTHTLHMNHGSEFWAKLEQVYPNAKKVAKEVRRLQP